jgi:hypothetical protein
MKRFTAQLNDGSFVNVQADKMEVKDNAIWVTDGQELVAYVDISCVLCAHVSERATA